MDYRVGSVSRHPRIEGVDVARGVASLIMIQGHAYDGWVAAEHKGSAAYLFTRLLGSLPLPAFLVLAGAAIVLRVEAARRRNEDAATVRRGVVRRGFVVLAWGYATNVAYALMDGWDGLDTFLRADVLHVIGLSIVALALFGIRGPAIPSRRALAWAAAGLAAIPTLLCPWLAPLGASVPGAARPLAALFVDVPGLTRMPFVPLSAWLGVGALASLAMVHARERSTAPRTGAGAPDRFLILLGAGGLAAAVLGHLGTGALVAGLGGSLSRAHPAVWLNVVDLAGRGVLVLAAAALVSMRLPTRVRAVLVRLGRGSLVAYVFHIPFCYGALGAPVRGRLDMLGATGLVAVLMVASWLAVYARDRWKGRRTLRLAPARGV